MKRIYTLLSIVFLATLSINAQEANDCSVNLSLEHDFVKSRRYEEAFPYWEKVYKACPDSNQAIYSDGIKIYKNRFNEAVKAKDNAKAKEILNTLVSLYDDWIKYFPTSKYIGKMYQDKGLLLMRNKMATKEELYNIFTEGYTKGKSRFTNPSAIYAYFDATVDMYKNKKVDFEKLIEVYDALTGTIESSIEKYTVKMEELQKKEDAGEIMKKEARKLKAIKTNIPSYSVVAGEMDKVLGDLGDCKHLVPLYKKNYEANKESAVWLKKAANNLSKKDCSSDPIFKTLVIQLDKINPTYNSKFFLGILFEKEGQKAKAIAYYKEAISLSNKSYDKAKIYLKLATMAKRSGQKAKARTYAKQALANRPSLGSAYLLIAQLYKDSANSCGKTEFEKRATFWLAAKMAEKAASVDPSKAKIAKKMAKRYRSMAPSKEDVFMKNMAGKTIPMKCWIGGSVTVPSK